MAKTFHVTLHYPDGSPMFRGTLTTEEVEPVAQRPSAQPPTGPANSHPVPQRSASGTNGANGITEKQIKALYAIVRREQRLTANDQIAQWLRGHFHVRRLDDIARDTATAFIRQHEPEGGRASGT